MTNVTQGFLTVLCVLAIMTSTNGSSDISAKRSKPPRARLNYFVRCTRRYTPGLCTQPVVPVWTFVFHLQNCTERYGCPQDWRTNRFTTYARCVRRCKPLIDFYTEILSREPGNLTDYMRSQPWNKSARRDSGDDESYTDVQEEEYDSLTVESGLKGPAPSRLDHDVDHNDWAVTVDIDDVHMEGVASDDFIDHDYFKHYIR